MTHVNPYTGVWKEEAAIVNINLVNEDAVRFPNTRSRFLKSISQLS